MLSERIVYLLYEITKQTFFISSRAMVKFNIFLPNYINATSVKVIRDRKTDPSFEYKAAKSFYEFKFSGLAYS